MENNKFASLVHYIIWKCTDEPSKLGSTKLNKILWYSDIISYRDNGQSITNAKYIKRQFGPTPEFHILNSTENTLESHNKITSYYVENYGKRQKQFIAKVKPDISNFSPEEISVIDEIIYKIKNQTASEVSEETHANFWWESLAIGEEIPNYSIFANKGEITIEDIKWAESNNWGN